MQLYGIVGAGGFAREVMPVAQEMLGRTKQARDYELVFVVERPESAASINNYRAVTEDEYFAENADRRFNTAIADYKIRERIAKKFIDGGATPFSITAANNVCLSGNEIGQGAILCPFTTITSDAKIGEFFHANIYSYVAHDCRIGNFVTFAPRVCCNGRVIIEDYAYIGTGAIIKDGSDAKPIIIGRGAVVGMGAVVTKSVPPFTTVVGNPAAPLKKQSEI